MSDVSEDMQTSRNAAEWLHEKHITSRETASYRLAKGRTCTDYTVNYSDHHGAEQAGGNGSHVRFGGHGAHLSSGARTREH
eukprot:14417719-Heterocapsa_arctica.AAC.1